MTRPGAPSPRGRHSAPEESGRHAAPEPSPAEPRRRRRHAAPDEEDALPLERHRGGPAAYGSAPPAALPYNGPGAAAPAHGPGAEPPVNGYGGPPLNGHGTAAPVHRYGAEPPVNGYGAEPPVNGYGAAPPVNGHGAGPLVNGYGAEPPVNGYGAGPPVNGYGTEPSLNGYGAAPLNGHGAGPSSRGYGDPAPPLDGRHAATPRGGQDIAPPLDGYGYGYRDEPAFPDAGGHAVRPLDGYRDRAGRHGAEPIRGFPYTAPPPDAPPAWPVNGHGVDGAERDARQWPVDGHAAPPVNGHGAHGAHGAHGSHSTTVNGHARPLNGHSALDGSPAVDDGPDVGGGERAPLAGWQREPLRPAYPAAAPPAPVPPLETPVRPAPGPAPGRAAGPGQPAAFALDADDESTQVLRRYVPAAETLGRERTESRGRPPKPPHPPRAVVRRRQARRRRLEWPFLIVFALLSAYLIRAYVVQTFYIPSASMHETLVEGDRVLVNKISYRVHDVHRGDVIVFTKPPKLDADEDDLIKRVVALPGETVEGRGGKVYVNGAPLTEPYVAPSCAVNTSDFAPVTVPAGDLWVMGDNRCNSADSRYFGVIDEHTVVGRAFVLVWPVGRFAGL